MTTLIPYNRVQYVWISSHYDIHLHGLCRFGAANELHEFKTTNPDTFDEPLMVSVIKLTTKQKIHWLIRKKLFEICVGYHWTYPHRANGVAYEQKAPKWFWGPIMKWYYRWLSAR